MPFRDTDDGTSGTPLFAVGNGGEVALKAAGNEVDRGLEGLGIAVAAGSGASGLRHAVDALDHSAGPSASEVVEDPEQVLSGPASPTRGFRSSKRRGSSGTPPRSSRRTSRPASTDLRAAPERTSGLTVACHESAESVPSRASRCPKPGGAGTEPQLGDRGPRRGKPHREAPSHALKDGGDEGARTPGLLIANQALYQLSYIPVGEVLCTARGGGVKRASRLRRAP